MYWILADDGRTPINIDDHVAWGAFMKGDARVLDRTEIVPGVDVSTVFLGIDHNFIGGSKPLLWETMVFGRQRKEDDAEIQLRYATYAEALAGHRRICAEMLIEHESREETIARLVRFIGDA
jgi:hypothetical protein